MSTSAAQAIPSLVSLVTCADTVMRHPLEFDALLPWVMEYFDEAAKVKFYIETYYPSALNKIFFTNFENIVEGCISRFNFRKTWETMLQIKSNHIKVSLPSPVTAAPALFIEQFAEKEGTLKDAVEIGEKITDLYHQSFNKADLCYGNSFCAYCSGTPSHLAHTCPAHSARAVHPCGPCMREGTECYFAGLSSECQACHKSLLRQCIGGVPDQQILLMPFEDAHPEDDEHILEIIDKLIDLDLYRTKLLADIPSDPHTEEIVDNAMKYVSTNFGQFPFCSYKSIKSLVHTKEAFFQRLKSNMRNLYLDLKMHHVLVQHYCLVTAKLDEAHVQAEASTAKRKHQRNSRGYGRKQNQAQDKGRGKKDDCKSKGKNHATAHLKKCPGWACKHKDCDYYQEPEDAIQGPCDCGGWGNCGLPACTFNKGSWGQTDKDINQYQDNDNGYGSYSGSWGNASGSKRYMLNECRGTGMDIPVKL
ncbi:hypothetical protein EV421DRAFT_1742211 [Armillaria borealis]|uniref:Uncharacterized protein n=1 Tax=Armillaria borealis TaxID=47425 RepID=A0AA39MFQ0_9AGAR|nr:hypothetical protein EV421DRAFT_1742211 [Armillaria borealis]